MKNVFIKYKDIDLSIDGTMDYKNNNFDIDRIIYTDKNEISVDVTDLIYNISCRIYSDIENECFFKILNEVNDEATMKNL